MQIRGLIQDFWAQAWVLIQFVRNSCMNEYSSSCLVGRRTRLSQRNAKTGLNSNEITRISKVGNIE